MRVLTIAILVGWSHHICQCTGEAGGEWSRSANTAWDTTKLGIKHWIECRGEIIAQVVNARGGLIGEEEIVWHYGQKETALVRSEIPGWSFEGRYPSVGHCLVAVARSHRRFVEAKLVQNV